MLREIRWFIILLSLAGIMGISFLSCADPSVEGMIVATVIPGEKQSSDLSSPAYRDFPEGAQIMAIGPEQGAAQLLPLTGDFHAACAPDISYDAQRMIFTAQRSKKDVWQIFEMELGSLEYRQLTQSNNNCYDPVYLPGGRILYSEAVRKGNRTTGHALMVIEADGGAPEQVTFSPGSYARNSILHDGRILTINMQEESVEGGRNLMVMRPDGTKETLFYQSAEKDQLIGKGRETPAGQILLIERSKDGSGELITLDYNNPMHSKKHLSSSLPGDIIGAAPKGRDHLLVCYREPDENTFDLYTLDPEHPKDLEPFFKDDHFQFTEVMAVEKRTRPKKIPSEVNRTAETGLLLCQDINFKGFQKDSLAENRGKAVQIEVLGPDSSMGVVNAERDGSVYLKIKADTPFRLQTLDKNGEIISGPSSWIYLRPNERRACVGCHQGNEVVPENRQPLSVMKEPVMIPQQNKIMAKVQ